MVVHTSTRELRQEDCKLKVSLGYRVRLSLRGEKRGGEGRAGRRDKTD